MLCLFIFHRASSMALISPKTTGPPPWPRRSYDTSYPTDVRCETDRTQQELLRQVAGHADAGRAPRP
ncbi:MAG: hypothetical protein ACUVXI_07725 [bacterium]